MGNTDRTSNGGDTTQGRHRVERVWLRPRSGESDAHAPRPRPTFEPRLTMPSHPAIPARGRTVDERSLFSRVSQRLGGRRLHADGPRDESSTWESYPVPPGEESLEGYTWDDWDTPNDSGSRSREHSAARPLNTRTASTKSPIVPPAPGRTTQTSRHGTPQPPARSLVPHGQTQGRALSVVASVAPPMSPHHTPHLPPHLLQRTPAATRAAIKKASSPWSVTRVVLVLCTIVLALMVSIAKTGDHGFTPLVFKTSASSGAVRTVNADVKPITQLLECNQYDSYAQCQLYGDAACSAAATTEVLTAWGVPGMSIGRAIDEFGNDISPYGGLLTHAGFARVAAIHGFRAEEHTGLTYNQMLYITNTLGIPLIVDVRITYGYYRFLSGGHFLVVTGGDQNGVSIADSSTYYIHYLPKDIFYSMFTNQATLIVPKDFQYSLPPN